LVTRAIAFAIDAALINLSALVVAACAALIVSLLHLPQGLRHVVAAAGAAAYVMWTIGYFVSFWSATGQTPGGRVMQFRVVGAKGERLTPRRALIRWIGLLIAALPLFAGYLMILFDSRRRGLHDRLARTLAVEALQLSIAAQRRVHLRRAAGFELRSPHSGDERHGSLTQATGKRDRPPSAPAGWA
jgi:uncharacterized RDD family membrane protein YckC